MTMKTVVYCLVAFAALPLVWCACDNFLDVLQDTASGLDPCPCTASDASADTDFTESSFRISTYHPGAASCYRSATASSSGSGQQCCYSSSGGIIVGPPGGGTADRYSPIGALYTARHWVYDVRPWNACCKGRLWSADCELYYQYRPSHDCTGYTG